MKKNVLGIFSLALLAIIVSIGYYFGFKGDQVSANPDYICTKSVTNQPCIVPENGWSEWDENGIRTGTGTMATEVRYYATRTGCEKGYTTKRGGGYTGGASGRKTADFISSSKVCTITQEDSVPPVGEINN